CEMHHRVDLVSGENSLKGLTIAHICTIEGRDRPSGNLRHALECHPVRIAQIVDDDHFVARSQQRDTGVRTDVAGTAGHEHTCHAALRTMKVMARTCAASIWREYQSCPAADIC